MFVITSTYLGIPQPRCVRSVETQTLYDWRHLYLDALNGELHELATGTVTEWPADLGALGNQLRMWEDLHDDDVIVMLDGDDWFASDWALEHVSRAYAAGAMMTYGSFMWRDGRIGFGSPVGTDPRAEPWRASHLKTCRAGLIKRIKDADLRRTDGEYFRCAGDQALMLPMLEMAGARATWIPEILYCYNAPPYVASADAFSEVRTIRERPRYERLY